MLNCFGIPFVVIEAPVLVRFPCCCGATSLASQNLVNTKKIVGQPIPGPTAQMPGLQVDLLHEQLKNGVVSERCCIIQRFVHASTKKDDKTLSREQVLPNKVKEQEKRQGAG